MNRWALPLLVLLAAPFAAAGLEHSGTSSSDQPHVPQMHCAFVQTEARTRADPAYCDVRGGLNSVHILRIRATGFAAGTRAYAFLTDLDKSTQIAQLECIPTLTQTTCIKTLPRSGPFDPSFSAPRVRLYASLEGPGPSAATVTVEKIQYSLP